MAVYNANRTTLGSIETDPRYFGESGLFTKMMDDIENDQLMFEATLGNDFREIAFERKGLLTEAEEVNGAKSQESWKDKVIGWLKNAWKKIKSLLEGFLAKIKNWIIRDNREYVLKTKSKVDAKDLSELKYTYGEPKKDLEKAKNLYTINQIVEKYVSEIEELKNASADKISELEKSLKDGTRLNEILGKALGDSNGVTEANFAEKYHNEYFNEVKEHVGLKKSELEAIINDLLNGKVAITLLENSKKMLIYYLVKDSPSLNHKRLLLVIMKKKIKSLQQ